MKTTLKAGCCVLNVAKEDEIVLCRKTSSLGMSTGGGFGTPASDGSSWKASIQFVSKRSSNASSAAGMHRTWRVRRSSCEYMSTGGLVSLLCLLPKLSESFFRANMKDFLNTYDHNAGAFQ